MERFKYSRPSWSDREYLKPKISRGGDEWCNPSVYAYFPFIGSFTYYYGRTIDRSKWWYSGGRKNDDGSWDNHYISPDQSTFAHVPEDEDPMDHDCPHTKTAEWITSRATSYESLEDDDDD